MEIFKRNELIWGADFQEKLKSKHVTVFGLGGVGGFALESLARSGVENFTIVDFDTINESNINRQIIALHSTLGEKKTELFKSRLLDINPNIKLKCVDNFYSDRLDEEIFSQKPDSKTDSKTNYIIDAIDTMRSKIELLVYCHKNNLPVITSMGAGNRIDPTQLYIADISELQSTKCTFSKNVIYQLKKQGITSGITAVASHEPPKQLEKYSTQETIKTSDGETFEFTKFSPGSTPFVPAVAGYYLGYWVIRSLL